jgi:hypothetical protein
MAGESGGWLAVAGVVGGLAGALVTGGFNYFGHQTDLDAKMIELSVGILRAAPTPETTPLREWAIDVIDKRAKFPFNAAQRATLIKKELPFKGSYWGGSYWGDFKFGPAITSAPNVISCPLLSDEKTTQKWTCPIGSQCGPNGSGSCVTK